MKRLLGTTISLLIVAFTAYGCATEPSGQTDAAWTTLFDGRNLDNWNQVGDANWQLVDGVVQADKGSGFLVSKYGCRHYPSPATSRLFISRENLLKPRLAAEFDPADPDLAVTFAAILARTGTSRERER